MIVLPASPTPADLWRSARAWLADALRRFGGPAAIAALRARRSLKALARRIAALDSLVSKLLLVQAARLHAFPAGAQDDQRQHERAARVRAPAAHRPEDAADPSSWRVRFHPRIPRGPTRCVAAASPPRAGPPRSAQHHARALARRIEALARVIADPRHAAAALARKLAALGAAAYAAARRIARFSPPRRRRERLVHAHALIAACDASKVFHADTS